MIGSVELQTSNDILKDLLALLNMYKAMDGMIKRFTFDSQNTLQWDAQITEYHEAILTMYNNGVSHMTEDDKKIFLAQSAKHINIF